MSVIVFAHKRVKKYLSDPKVTLKNPMVRLHLIFTT